MYKELDCYGIFHVFYTKPGRHRRIAIQHHHVLNSQLLCPLCHFATYMFYRICYNDTPLKEGHPMFIFEGVAGKWFPMTSAIFNSTLLKVCMDIGLLKVTKSNFKIGILTELWHSSILNILPFHPDLRFFLMVDDHRTDYHQNYIIPDLLTISSCLQKVREINLVRFFHGLSGEERNGLLLKIIHLLPGPVPDTSGTRIQKSWDKDNIAKLSVRRMERVSVALPNTQH